MTENITTGVIRTYYPDGQLEEEYFVCNGKREGIYKKYWSDGKLYEEVNYIDGEVMVYKQYWGSGQLHYEINSIDRINKKK